MVNQSCCFSGIRMPFRVIFLELLLKMWDYLLDLGAVIFCL